LQFHLRTELVLKEIREYSLFHQHTKTSGKQLWTKTTHSFTRLTSTTKKFTC
jgi:hypothetical protein